ncbi:benzoate 4-monooxygenase cytochrome P450 [Penicillium argentinense]|uniref:Benzoate 4-monooxygenase cytochrome P450 n=1 Tax=Penicillium argentinense TaxID=1131581 RepID=A0A9W9G0R8_9EURO|nr:benzoate 4-monooxygenase cytochrome P450 [Penicillium argentinense]KAJ5110004.1 benzoate 4-monooxygenase cytochrome P450 [Penicillium argentinense]
MAFHESASAYHGWDGFWLCCSASHRAWNDVSIQMTELRVIDLICSARSEVASVSLAYKILSEPRFCQTSAKVVSSVPMTVYPLWLEIVSTSFLVLRSALAKLRAEVTSVLSGEAIAPFAKVKGLPYLRACLDESVRILPPLPHGLERKIPPQGMQILGEQIAGVVTVSVPTYAAHRDPIQLPEPEKYIPEKWLDASDATKDMRAAFIPFRSGARACLGRNITMMDQQILVATLLHGYGFCLPFEEWELDWEDAFNLWPCDMHLKVWRRGVDSGLEIF